MTADISNIIGQLMNAAQENPGFADEFQADPTSFIEQLTGVGISGDSLQEVLSGLQSRIGAAQQDASAADPLSGLMGMVTSMLATEGLDVDGDGDVDLDDLKSGIMGALL